MLNFHISIQPLRCVVVISFPLLSFHTEEADELSQLLLHRAALLPASHSQGTCKRAGILTAHPFLFWEKMTNASIRLAFTSLSSEDWVPSYIQGIFDEQLLGSGAGLSNYRHELCCSRVTCAYPILPFFFSCSQISFQVRSLTRLHRRLTQPCLRGSYKRTDIARGGLAQRYWGVLNQLKAGLLGTAQPRPQRSGGFDMDTEALKKAGKKARKIG